MHNPSPSQGRSEESGTTSDSGSYSVTQGVTKPPAQVTSSPAKIVDTVSVDEVSLTIIFSSSTYSELMQLAGGEYGIGEFLRSAIALNKWFNKTLKDGDKIFVKRKGKLREVVKV